MAQWDINMYFWHTINVDSALEITKELYEEIDSALDLVYQITILNYKRYRKY